MRGWLGWGWYTNEDNKCIKETIVGATTAGEGSRNEDQDGGMK
jgi:hypothetical protein